MSSTTFTVRGHKIRTTSNRRFMVVRITTDKWAVMDVITSSWGHDFHQVASDIIGRRLVFGSEAEAVAARTGDQVVKVWTTEGARIEKRSDSLATARKMAAAVGSAVVVDTVTGEEV